VNIIEYLWQRIERGDAPQVLAAALNNPPIRDALLRRAALHDQWQALAAAAAQASRSARAAGWSQAGPDAAAAVCHWVSADQLLRGIPQHDRAAGLAAAVLSSWDNPSEVAGAIAGTPPLDPRAGQAFEQALTADQTAAAGPAQEVLDELDTAMREDPELVAYALNTGPVRDALLRQAARTGDWEELLQASLDAAEAARAAGSRDDGPEVVAAMCEWITGDEDAARQRLARQTHHPLSAALEAAWGHPGAALEVLAASAPLDDLAARRFLADLDGPPQSLVSGWEQNRQSGQSRRL